MAHGDSWAPFVQSLFWEYDQADLCWEDDRDLIIRRVLSQGNHHAIRWLRRHVGDVQLREWLLQRSGDQLSPKQLRFWELILDLPSEQVDAWVDTWRHGIWHSRRAESQ